MAGPYVPPWLQVSPRDFTQAAAEGGSLGARLGALATEAGMNRERIASSERENAARLAAAQAEAASRAKEQEKYHELARQTAQWELTQRLASEEARARDALAERTMYGQGVLSNREEANRIRSEMNDIRERALDNKTPKIDRIATKEPIWERNPDTGDWEQKTKGSGGAADELPSVLNDAAVKPSGFSLFHPSTWFGHAAPAAEAAAPAAPALGAIPALTPATNAPAPSPYKVGGNYGGLIFKGGDPTVQDSWEPVGDTAR
jgi:hypothetical protein